MDRGTPIRRNCERGHKLPLQHHPYPEKEKNGLAKLLRRIFSSDERLANTSGGSVVRLFPYSWSLFSDERPAKSPAFNDVMLLLSRSRRIIDARWLLVTNAQSSTPDILARISSCTCCVRSQMPVFCAYVWATVRIWRKTSKTEENIIYPIIKIDFSKFLSRTLSPPYVMCDLFYSGYWQLNRLRVRKDQFQILLEESRRKPAALRLFLNFIIYAKSVPM